MTSDNVPQPFNETSRGAVLHTTHMERTVKVYGVTESELKQISLLNTLTLVFSSVGSFFLAVAISIVLGWSTLETATERATIFLQCVAPVCGIEIGCQ